MSEKKSNLFNKFFMFIKKIFNKLILFVKEIIDELKKVVYPTKKEVRTYSIVVIVFLVIVTAFISLIDITGGKLIMLIFE